MTTKSAVEHWIRLADYDWKSAQTMLKAKHYLYVGFLCHQVIEKLYKALFTKINGKIPPYTHDLIKLASLTIAPPYEAGRSHLNTLNPLYIKCRYPAYRVRLSRILTSGRASEIMRGTKEMKTWLKSRLGPKNR